MLVFLRRPFFFDFLAERVLCLRVRVLCLRVVLRLRFPPLTFANRSRSSSSVSGTYVPYVVRSSCCMLSKSFPLKL